MKKAPYVLVTTFSEHLFGGNPAAIVFTELTQPNGYYEGIAKNLNQPMTAFVEPKAANPSNRPHTATFNILFFTYDGEFKLCGHATLAAAKAIFDEHLVSPDINILEFEARTGNLSAWRLNDGSFEIHFPSCIPEEISPLERALLVPMINNAFNRKLAIGYIGRGGGNGHYGNYVMVEIGEEEDLENSVVNTAALRDSGYDIHIVTKTSPNKEELFVSRMFTERVPGGEDPVCGTAHCLIGPYWYRKYGIQAGDEVKATQTSPRRGHLRLVWLESEGTMVVRGMTAVLGRGELYV